MTRLAIIYATLGRAEILSQVVARLAVQSRQPDIVVISAVSPADTAGIDASPIRSEILYGPPGSCTQRNRAIAHVIDRADIAVFFDDDFVPDDAYLQEVVDLFEARPELAGATGRMIADGILTAGYSFKDAIAFIAADVRPRDPAVTPRTSLYGCNMAIRLATLDDLRFDEHLPLYGWLEDIELTYRLSWRGPLVTSERLAGVHMGVKRGRTSGIRFGYSQIANPIYMLRRGTIPRRLAFQRMARNLVSNIVRSARPEPYIDRLGRLRGNLLALRDFTSGQLDPVRILSLD